MNSTQKGEQVRRKTDRKEKVKQKEHERRGHIGRTEGRGGGKNTPNRIGAGKKLLSVRVKKPKQRNVKVTQVAHGDIVLKRSDAARPT